MPVLEENSVRVMQLLNMVKGEEPQDLPAVVGALLFLSLTDQEVEDFFGPDGPDVEKLQPAHDRLKELLDANNFGL